MLAGGTDGGGGYDGDDADAVGERHELPWGGRRQGGRNTHMAMHCAWSCIAAAACTRLSDTAAAQAAPPLFDEPLRAARVMGAASGTNFATSRCRTVTAITCFLASWALKLPNKLSLALEVLQGCLQGIACMLTALMPFRPL